VSELIIRVTEYVPPGEVYASATAYAALVKMLERMELLQELAAAVSSVLTEETIQEDLCCFIQGARVIELSEQLNKKDLRRD